MNIKRSWMHEFLLLMVLIAVVITLGLMAEALDTAVLLGGLVYLGWHLLQMLRYQIWMRDGKKHDQPIALGVWQAAIDGAVELRQNQRQRELRLLHMLKGFQVSTNALPDATLVVDEAGMIEWINEAATRLLGFSGGDVKPMTLSTILASTRLTSYLKQANFQHPIKITSPLDQNVLLELRAARFAESKLLMQLRDISRLEQLETIRQDFVANVSHEMRTPLTVIRGYLESMHDAADADADTLRGWQPVIEQLQRQATRLQQIVEDLLLLSRIEQGEIAPQDELVKVPKMLHSLQREAQLLSAEGHHQISLQQDEKLLLRGRESELRSLFANLIFNALAYTPPRGQIQIKWHLQDNVAVFSVSDTGIGIEQQHIPRLTERFYRVDEGRSRTSGGTGLGLAIVKHVLKRHDGSLLIESRYGVGSHFECRFPPSRVSTMQ